jgi:hypothetical protein
VQKVASINREDTDGLKSKRAFPVKSYMSAIGKRPRWWMKHSTSVSDPKYV